MFNITALLWKQYKGPSNLVLSSARIGSGEPFRERWGRVTYDRGLSHSVRGRTLDQGSFQPRVALAPKLALSGHQP